MTPLYQGHLYILDHLDGPGNTVLQFVQRKPLHEPKEGVTNQEVLRAVIDRVKHLNAEIPWIGNSEIIYHLRMAIALHECRAIMRHIKNHDFAIEDAILGKDGHLLLHQTEVPGELPDSDRNINAFELAESSFPGKYWTFGRGRTGPDEPLYGFRVFEPGDTDNPIAEGEHDDPIECIRLAKATS